MSYFDLSNRSALYAEADRRLAALSPAERQLVDWKSLRHHQKGDLMEFSDGHLVIAQVTKNLIVTRPGEMPPVPYAEAERVAVEMYQLGMKDGKKAANERHRRASKNAMRGILTRDMLPASAPKVRMRYNPALGDWEPAGYVTREIAP